MSKPRVSTRCVANNHAQRNERIVEVSSDGGGCLISLLAVQGSLSVNVYRADPSVVVYTQHDPRPADAEACGIALDWLEQHGGFAREVAILRGLLPAMASA